MPTTTVTIQPAQRTIPDDADCRLCGAQAEQRTCRDCGATAMIVDCGCKAQPRPIAADESGDPVCDACSDTRAAEANQGHVGDLVIWADGGWTLQDESGGIPYESSHSRAIELEDAIVEAGVQRDPGRAVVRCDNPDGICYPVRWWAQ